MTVQIHGSDGVFQCTCSQQFVTPFLAYLLVLTVFLIPYKATGNKSFSSHESSCWRYSLPIPFQFLKIQHGGHQGRRSSKFLGVFTRNFSDARVLFSRQPPRQNVCVSEMLFIRGAICTGFADVHRMQHAVLDPTKVITSLSTLFTNISMHILHSVLYT